MIYFRKRLSISFSQPDTLQAISHLHDPPDQQEDEDRKEAHLKHHAQDRQNQPQPQAQAAGHHVSPAAGLADLAALRLVAAVHPLFLKLRVVDAAPLLRVHPAGQVHGLLLGKDHKAAGEEEHAHQGQGPDIPVHPIDAEGGEEEQVEQQLYGAEEQDPAQGGVDGLRGFVLVPAVPGGEFLRGGAVEDKAASQGQRRGGGDAPGGNRRQGGAQPLRQGGGIQAHGPGKANGKADDASHQQGAQQGQGEFGQGLSVLAFLIHGFRPPDR